MQQFRLAAIMHVLRSDNVGGPARRSQCEGGFIDIIGYTKLMGSDEELAFELLQKNRSIIKTLIKIFFVNS